MNKSTHYNRIRQLIADWYDGNISPADEKEIIRFFKEADAGSLPDDLRQEATVFHSVDMLTADNPDKALIAEIEAEANRERNSRRLKLRRRLVAVATTVAASIALLLFFGLKPGSNPSNTTPSLMLASVDKGASEPGDSDSTVTVTAPLPETETDTVTKPAKPAAPKAKPRTVRPRPQREAIAQVVDDEGYTHIDNPEEVARILDGVQTRYSRALTMTTKAITEVETAFDNTENALRNTIEKS